MKSFPKSVTAMALLVLGLTACNWGRPIINGEGTGQPIMDGWTREMAGEFWLPSVLNDEMPRSAEEVAHLNKVNVQVKLPVHEDNPMPRDGVTYRQASTGGFITFHLGGVEGDSLHPVGTADLFLREPMYFDLDTIKDVRVRSYGKGIFTTYTIKQQRSHKKPENYHEYVEFFPAIISVYPDGDSLLICRGNAIGDAYVVEP